MRRNFSARLMLRRAQIERCEDRLVFSSVPWLDVCDQQPPDLVSAPPDWVELAPEIEPAGSLNAFTTSLEQVRNTYGFYGAGQTVAIIDTGIAWDHVALGGGLGSGYRVVGGWDFTEENDADPYDDGPAGFHGTHVAGIVGAQDDRHSGVAPEVDLVALRVFNDQGFGYTEWVEQALEWVHEHRDDYRFPITTVNLSLGAQWNGDAPPQWASLEDELAQLARDGIFVAAAAGNSYAVYGQPGLAYPAASPYVVPVASVGADGQLSAFSQRHDRALGAPGEFIMSTVPDYILGSDGRLDDWAAASGTSMAAPYLAGASVLVREAMQFVEYASIDQPTIYDHLRDTADLVFDSDSDAYYHVLNLSRAIDSLLPVDDFSSLLASPFDLGALESSQTVTGQLARLDDQDVFQFTAVTDGQLSWNVTGCGAFELAVGKSGGHLASGDTESGMRVEAGQTYTIVLSACDHLANYQLDLSLEPDQLVVVDGNRVQVNGTAGDDVVRFWIDNAYRIEVNGRQHQFALNRQWRFQFASGGGDDQLFLTGSAQSDVVTLRAGSASITAPGFSLTASSFENITVLAGGGWDDVVRIYGTDGNDRFVASPDSAEMASAGYVNRAVGFDRVYAYAGAGADDAARLHDSAGNDLFTADPYSGMLQGEGYLLKAWNFDRLYAYASSGSDTARLFDSSGSDLFVGTARAGSMESDSHFVKAWHFDRVYAYASAGAHDIARLYDSSGNDLFVGTPRAGWMESAVHYVKAWHFDRVYGYATSGGNDAVRMIGSSGDDTLFARARSTALDGEAYFYKAWHFERVVAEAGTAGHDVARFYDSPQDDLFVGNAGASELRGESYTAVARSFDLVYAIPAIDSGADRASLPEATGADEFLAWDDRTTLRVVGVQTAWDALTPFDRLLEQLSMEDRYQASVRWADVDQAIGEATNRATGNRLRKQSSETIAEVDNEPHRYLAPADKAPVTVESNALPSRPVSQTPLDKLNGLLDEPYLESLDELFSTERP